MRKRFPFLGVSAAFGAVFTLSVVGAVAWKRMEAHVPPSVEAPRSEGALEVDVAKATITPQPKNKPFDLAATVVSQELISAPQEPSESPPEEFAGIVRLEDLAVLNALPQEDAPPPEPLESFDQPIY